MLWFSFANIWRYCLLAIITGALVVWPALAPVEVPSRVLLGGSLEVVSVLFYLRNFLPRPCRLGRTDRV